MVSLNCTIGGRSFDNIVELLSRQILITYDHGAVQANITIEDITLVNEAAVFVRQYLAEGLTGGAGIFEGLPVRITMTDGVAIPVTIFDGYIDFTQNLKIFSPVKMKAKLVNRKGLNDFEHRLSALTYGYLNSLQPPLFVKQDFRIVRTRIIKFDQTLENMLLGFLAFEAAYNLVSIVNKIQTDALVPGVDAVTVPLDIVYAAIVAVEWIILAKKIFDQIFPVPKNNLGISYYTAIQKVCQFLGYDFTTSINELNSKEWIYLPSKPDETAVFGTKGLTKGIPQANDFGYACNEMFEIVLKLFDAKLAITPNQSSSAFSHTVQIHNIASPAWKRISTYSIPDTLEGAETIEYNTDEYKANRIIKFTTDVSDEWTVKNFKGTNIEIITDAITVNDKYSKLNKGLEEITIPTALGNVHDVLEGYELELKVFAHAVDELLKRFKSPIRFSPLVENRGAPLKVTGTTWNIPKTLAVKSDGNLFADQRKRVSAEYLWDNYYKYSRSFLPNNPFGQKRIFNNIKVPFGFSDFVKLLNSSYFAGSNGKMETINWSFDSDYAEVNYWIHESYTNNLKETKVSP